MSFKVKRGVQLDGLDVRMLYAVYMAAEVYHHRGIDLVVTSGFEGTHMKGSLHYVGRAIDIRLPPENASSIVGELKLWLGDCFDVVLEDTHIHIEYDP